MSKLVFVLMFLDAPIINLYRITGICICCSHFSGFNAAVSGCFFAVESVLWPSPADSSSSSVSLTNTTSMVILSAVIASVVTQVGLGSEPAFKVPGYDFRAPTGTPPSYL